MTSRAHIETTPDLIERMAFGTGLVIERSSDTERVYLTIANTTYWAPSPNVIGGAA